MRSDEGSWWWVRPSARAGLRATNVWLLQMPDNRPVTKREVSARVTVAIVLAAGPLVCDAVHAYATAKAPSAFDWTKYLLDANRAVYWLCLCGAVWLVVFWVYFLGERRKRLALERAAWQLRELLCEGAELRQAFLRAHYGHHGGVANCTTRAEAWRIEIQDARITAMAVGQIDLSRDSGFIRVPLYGAAAAMPGMEPSAADGWLAIIDNESKFAVPVLWTLDALRRATRREDLGAPSGLGER